MKSKFINRLFSAVAALLLLVALVPTSVFATSDIQPFSLIGTGVAHFDAASGSQLRDDQGRPIDVFPADLIDLPGTSDIGEPDLEAGYYTPQIPNNQREYIVDGVKYTLAKIVVMIDNADLSSQETHEFSDLDNLTAVYIPEDAGMVSLIYYWNTEEVGTTEPNPGDDDEDEGRPTINNFIYSVDRTVAQNGDTLTSTKNENDVDVYRVTQDPEGAKTGLTLTYNTSMDMTNLGFGFPGDGSWNLLQANKDYIYDTTKVDLVFQFDDAIDVTTVDYSEAYLDSDMFVLKGDNADEWYTIDEAANTFTVHCRWDSATANSIDELDPMIYFNGLKVALPSDWDGADSITIVNDGKVEGRVDFGIENNTGYVEENYFGIDGGTAGDTFILTVDKVSEPGLEKWIVTDDGKVEMDDVAAGTEVTFELDSNVPDNLGKYISVEVDDPTIKAVDATDSYQLIFLDTLDPMFSDPTDFVVKIGDTELTSDQYVLDLSNAHQFTVTLDLAALYHANVITNEDIQGATPITVTYTATLSEDATADSYTNEAQVVYPGGQSSMDMVWVKTYAIKVFKYDQATRNGLEGAQFVLTHKGSDGTTIGSQMLTSGEDGYIRVDGLDAGNYELREIKAPEGYVCSDEVLEIVVSAEEAGDDYAIDVEFANTLIPHTGGTGTVMYTVGGLAIIVLAGILLVVYRKSRKKQDR